MVNFKPSEIEALDSYVAGKREKIAKQEEEDKEKVAAEKVKLLDHNKSYSILKNEVLL